VKTRSVHYRALPRRFRKTRLLVLGCGDVGLRLVRRFSDRFRIFGIVRRAESAPAVRAAGAVPVIADVNERRAGRRGAVARLAALATTVIHSAPPPASGEDDPLTRRAIAALHRAQRWVYLSTSGVYGDCAGARVDESRPVAPTSDRARRRVAAERRLRRHAAQAQKTVIVLRVPGIYAGDRLPIERLERGTPALDPRDDVYTNHVHAEDLAAIAVVAALRGAAGRTYHASDSSEMKMGEYFDAVADAFGLARPPRLPREQLRQAVSPMLYSFMSESRRLSNRRLLDELRVRLRYPSVAHYLASVTSPTAESRDRSAKANRDRGVI
jgi:nucleoside-diphosphate-sugar epimerase